jgi:hypothetical protein
MGLNVEVKEHEWGQLALALLSRSRRQPGRTGLLRRKSERICEEGLTDVRVDSIDLIIVLVLELVLDFRFARKSGFGIKKAVCRRRRGRLVRGRRAVRSSADFVGIEAIDQPGKHRHDASEHLLTGANPVLRDEALRNRSIETGGALDGRATRVIEKLGPLTAVTLTVALGRI